MKTEIRNVKTVGGSEIKYAQWNTAANKYLGRITDLKNPNFTTCTWFKNGKCINRNRPDLDIPKELLS